MTSATPPRASSTGSSICYGPMPVGEGIVRTREMLAQAHGVRWVEASLLGQLGYQLAMADRADEAREHYGLSRAIHEELGMTFTLAARA